jgi:hypothetical protein
MPREKKPKRKATCHPQLDAIGRGLCSRCYHAARRTGKLPAATNFLDLSPAAQSALLGPPLPLSETISETELHLVAALPEAAQALRRTLLTDVKTGLPLKAAALLLSRFPVAQPNGEQRRLLEAPAKAAETSRVAQVVIGLHVAAPGDVRVGQVVGVIAPTVQKGD